MTRAAARGAPVWKEMPVPAAPSTREAAQIVIVGAGPVGLTLALDLARRGRAVLILDKHRGITAGSKAICFSKRSLEIWDRLGVAADMLRRGVVWNVGKVFWGDGAEPLYQFDLLPLKDQKMPAFINLQQYYVEEILVKALQAMPNVELRFGHEVVDLRARADGVELEVSASGAGYEVHAEWLIACDGARSFIRRRMNLDFEGRGFDEHFLIADIRGRTARPAERWFWFDPPFNRGRSALLHKQPEDVWRLDFQLGWDIDKEECLEAHNVARMVRGMLGAETAFTPQWYSLYSFQCRRLSRFVWGRVIFAGDSAHLVSPFGARGCNGGIADADNLGWKLDRVLSRAAPLGLLESYNDEAVVTADENIRHASRSTDFMTPKSAFGRALRDGVLELARRHEFARPFVNSGRLSSAVSYPSSSLSTADRAEETWHGGCAPGCPPVDAPFNGAWLSERLGNRFVLLTQGWDGPLPEGVERLDVSAPGLDTVRARWNLTAGAACLLRPDQYVAARWRSPSAASVAAALRRATGSA